MTEPLDVWRVRGNPEFPNPRKEAQLCTPLPAFPHRASPLRRVQVEPPGGRLGMDYTSEGW